MRRSQQQYDLDVNLSAFSISDLPPMNFPPLPPIEDEALYKLVTTHSSLNIGQKTSMNLDPNHVVSDYEKLEHVGDALLGTVILPSSRIYLASSLSSC